jgi:UrcA family protein
MKTFIMIVVAGAAASGFASGTAAAQSAEGVTVTVSRSVETRVGTNYSGLPIKDVSLSYAVNLKDIDLASTAGAGELDKRVNDAARAACKDISRLYPISKPDDTACAKAAVDRAMPRIRELVAAARAQPAK